MPGIVDAHIHLGHGPDISRPRISRDAETESAAAAAGGVTTFLSYVISGKPFEPALIDEICAVTACREPRRFWPAPRHLDRRAACSGAYLRHGVRRAVLQALHVQPLRRGGAARVARHRRWLPVPPGRGRCPLPRHSLPALREHRGCQGPGPRLCNDPDGKGGLAAWNASRPPFVEAEAVHRVATLARQAGAPVYLVHCTSAAALEAALAQQRLGTDLTVETCTHYLTHTIGWKGGNVGEGRAADPGSG